MQLIAIAPKTLLGKNDWDKVKENFSVISFVDHKNILDFNYNKSQEEKALLLDPDYFDWKFPQEILYRIKNLKCVILTTTTASYIDERFLKSNKISLLTIPKYSTNSVAEYLVFLMMCLAKKLPLQLKNDSKQDFSDKYKQMELTGKTVGVVGLGNIGNRICEMVQGMGMIPTYWNRTTKESKFEYVELDKLFKNSDVIFITLANNSSTKHIITDDLLKSMKKSAILISGTGIELHSDSVVREMLEDGRLYGFGAELPNKSYIDYKGNAMITSEYAWFTNEATEKRLQIIVKNLLSIKKEENL
jgi:phosphoglycerate dehydrogenase-like enzyme